MYIDKIDSPIGQVYVICSDSAVTDIMFDKPYYYSDSCGKNSLTERTCSQLSEYFSGKRQTFELPLADAPTEFSRRVREALIAVPYGKTASYKDIAAAVGSPKACRAVGTANHNNPLPIIVPCHRIISADNSLGGYGGGLVRKIKLLEIEGITFTNDKLSNID